jgi:hypothetical protein
MTAVLVNRKKLFAIKENILKEFDNFCDENIQIEDFQIKKKYRQFTKFIVPFIFAYLLSTLALILLIPLFLSGEKLAMAVYVQLPWTK